MNNNGVNNGIGENIDHIACDLYGYHWNCQGKFH